MPACVAVNGPDSAAGLLGPVVFVSESVDANTGEPEQSCVANSSNLTEPVGRRPPETCAVSRSEWPKTTALGTGFVEIAGGGSATTLTVSAPQLDMTVVFASSPL